MWSKDLMIFDLGFICIGKSEIISIFAGFLKYKYLKYTDEK